jgi:hypothetical protein
MGKRYKTNESEQSFLFPLNIKDWPPEDHLATFVSDVYGVGIFSSRRIQCAGIMKLGRVALDGSKIKANASMHKAMSYERMMKQERQIRKEFGNCIKKLNRKMRGKTGFIAAIALGTNNPRN